MFWSSYGHGNGGIRWKEKKTYVVGVLGDEHTTWRMQDFKMSVDAATWGSKMHSRWD